MKPIVKKVLIGGIAAGIITAGILYFNKRRNSMSNNSNVDTAGNIFEFGSNSWDNGGNDFEVYVNGNRSYTYGKKLQKDAAGNM